MHGHNHQGKAAFESTIFHWVANTVFCPTRLQGFFVNISGTNQAISQFLTWRWSSSKGNVWDCLIWLVVASCVSCSNRLQDYLIFNILGRNQYLTFFAWRQSSRQGSIWQYPFWLILASCFSHPIRFQDFCIIISGKNHSII